MNSYTLQNEPGNSTSEIVSPLRENGDKIFVTGGSGLLGGYLLRALLQRNEDVVALYRNHYSSLLSEEETKKISWVKGDVFDTGLLEEMMQDCKKVYHCAGMVSFNPKKRNELLKVNKEGTANMVNAALNCNVKKLLHVSSVSALGRKRHNMVVTEEAKWDEESNNSNYGRSKFLAELEVWRGMSEGLDAVIVNPTIILGVGDWNNSSAAMFKNAYKEFPWYAEGVTGFVDAEDVAHVMIDLMESSITEERFIISAENRTFREVFTAMANAFGKKPPHRPVNPFLASLVWRFEKIKNAVSGTDPLLTKETAETAQLKVFFDNSKLKKFLPAFSFRPLEETINNYCHQYLAKLNG
jgi:dihydroflavonol-4-reductase